MIQKAQSAERLFSQKVEQATAIDHEWHGFGGSVISIRKAAQRSLVKWSDKYENTHRIKVLWSIMGSEKTRAKPRHGGYTKYTLEHHGKHQVETHDLEHCKEMFKK